VADHQQGALVLTQEAEQPGLRIDVEMVGRLVKGNDFYAKVNAEHSMPVSLR
jgi:hypothetical protein